MKKVGESIKIVLYGFAKGTDEYEIIFCYKFDVHEVFYEMYCQNTNR